MKKDIKISHIARVLNLSRSTVSKALNDRKDVSIETKRRVNTMAERMGYKPDYLARALVMKETKSIGLIVPDIECSFFPDIARSISDYMDRYGYRVVLTWSKGRGDKELSLLEDLKERKMDGIIIAPVSDNPNLSFFRRQFKEKYPIVTIDNFLPQLKYIPFVGTDFRKGSFLATDFLIKLGHRKTGFMGPFRGSFSAGERIRGYKTALKRAGIEIDRRYILDVPLSIQGGYEAIKKLFKNTTAVFCASDLIAIGALNYLKEKSIKVPEEFSVVGFSNLIQARNMEVPLTTMDQKTYVIAEKACEILLRLIHKEDLQERICLIEPELIVRKSTEKYGG